MKGTTDTSCGSIASSLSSGTRVSLTVMTGVDMVGNEYTIWFVYLGIRSEDITLTVLLGCPGSSTEIAASWELCTCASQRKVIFSTAWRFVNPATRANSFDVAEPLTVRIYVQVKTPSTATGGCQNIDYSYQARNSDLGLEWIVSQGGPLVSLGPVVGTKTYSWDAGALWAFIDIPGGTYAANGSYVFQAMKDSTVSLEMRLFPFTVTPRVLILTDKLTGSSTAAVTVPMSVADAYENGTIGEWSCVKTSGGSCPDSMTAALPSGGNSGVTVPAGQPIGSYTFWYIYKGVRSANVTLTIQLGCPTGGTAAVWQSCTCGTSVAATFYTPTKLTATTTRANTIDVASAFKLSFPITLVVPDTANPTSCRGTSFTSTANTAPSMLWNLASSTRGNLGVPAGAITAAYDNATEKLMVSIEVAANTLAAGQSYTFSVSSNGGSSSHTVDAMTTTPVINVGDPGSTHTVSPLQAFSKTITITDAYEDTTTLGTWDCATSGGEPCPAVMTAGFASSTNTQLTIPAGQPTGTYQFWMTYKGVRSDNITLTVEMSCPGVQVYVGPVSALSKLCDRSRWRSGQRLQPVQTRLTCEPVRPCLRSR